MIGGMTRSGESGCLGGEGPPRPMLAPVVPRVRALGAGSDAAALPLHERIRAILNNPSSRRKPRGIVGVVGGCGSGKTVALQHLAWVLDQEGQADTVELIDGGAFELAETRARSRLVVYSTITPPVCSVLASFEMSPWSRDDCIEYLLRVRRERCGSVVKRLSEVGAGEPGVGLTAAALQGLPELWRIVLDEMAEDESIAGPADALRHFLAAHLADPVRRDDAMSLCLRSFCADPAAQSPDLVELARLDPFMRRLIRFSAIRTLLGSQRFVWELCDGAADNALLCRALTCRLPYEMIAETAALIRHRPPALRNLQGMLGQDEDPARPAAIEVLMAADPDWQPTGPCPNLRGARLDGAHWAGVDLRGAFLCDQQMNRADLSRARLDGATFTGAHLAGTNFTGASLRKARADHATLIRAMLVGAEAVGVNFACADLTGADLCAANLTAAGFANADLTDAQLCRACFHMATFDRATVCGADLSGADFTGARLSHVCLRDCLLDGAIFRQANLLDCDLEEIELRMGNFQAAALTGSLLTGSTLPGADFSGADLRNTGLADVSWEGVDLHDADLTGASFHAGSTRSGLVGAPGTLPALEGSRTGFYTDDLCDRDFKPPEEIRKADLRNADLRGARVLKVDFYLVDLRGARYDREQKRHFRRCGAIL